VTGRRVLIADDHAATRRGVRLALEAGGFIVCAEAADAHSAIEAALREQPDICLVDVSMPGGGGIRAANEISRRLPTAQVVMLSVSPDDDDFLDALRAGAAGYLLKDMDAARLVTALESVLAGEAAIPRRLVAKLVDELRRRDRRGGNRVSKRALALSEREWASLELLNEGLSTAEIAQRLGISAVTVRRYVSDVVRKLGVPDRQAALDVFRETGSG
jgi:DNA-binding NarL/FixJ family response regulator